MATETPVAAREPRQRPVRQIGWINALVTRWGETIWTAFCKIAIIAIGVAALCAIIWIMVPDRDTDATNVQVLENRTFADVVTQSAPQNGAKLPVVGFLFNSGTYSVASGNCSFSIGFEDGTPVANVSAGDRGIVTIHDVDPTRLRAVPEVAQLCY